MAKKQILLVDDEPQLVDMVKIRLEANDYLVLTACDGQEGLEMAAKYKPDLILLDIMMPGIDGFEVLSRLRSNIETKYTPIIMLTCKGESASIFKVQDLGGTDYIVKPFNTQELLKLIKRYI